MKLNESGRTHQRYYLYLFVWWIWRNFFIPLSCNLIQYIGNPMKLEVTRVTSDVTESVWKRPIGVRSDTQIGLLLLRSRSKYQQSTTVCWQYLGPRIGVKIFLLLTKNHPTSKVNLTMLGQCFKMIKYKVRKSLSRFKYDPILVAHQSQFQVRSDGNPSSWNPSTIARQCNNALDSIL